MKKWDESGLDKDGQKRLNGLSWDEGYSIQ